MCCASQNPRGASVQVPADATETDSNGHTLVADYGECNYNPAYGWVVRQMWVTPADAADVWEDEFVWTDGKTQPEAIRAI